MRSCINFKKIDFITQCFQEQLMLGGYKCGCWKLVRDKDDKNCKFSNEFKNIFFIFSFINRENESLFFKFSSHHPLFLSNEDSCSSRL